jgi:hypothetical protein
VDELEANLKNSNRSFEEAQDEIADLKAKKKQEIDATVKSAEKAVKQAKTQTSKAKDMLAKNIAD